MNIGILGGGISGIALQRFLKHPSEVLEAASVPGGLCRTFWKEGFGYDIGGHVLFKGRYVKYPFENDLAALEVEDRYECLIDYLKADFPKPTNFAEWMYYTFGRGITERYLAPYNRKIWKMEPAQMGVEWVERIPKPPMEDVVKSALGIATEGYTHQLYFRYPLRGGVESLVRAMISEGTKVKCGARVQAI